MSALPTPCTPGPAHWAGIRRLRRTWRARGLATLPVLLGLLAACASPPPATTPPGPTSTGAHARLLLRGAVPADDRYAVFSLADPVRCQGPRQVASGNATTPPAPASLPAGVLTTLDFVVLRGGASGGHANCAVRWSFTPKAGKTYLVTGLVVGSGCTARLVDASTPDRPQSPPDLLLRSAPGQACLPLAQSRAAGNDNPLIQGGQYQGEAVLNPNATDRDLQGLIGP